MHPSKSAIKHATTLTGLEPGKCGAQHSRQRVITGTLVWSKAGTPLGCKEQGLDILLTVTSRQCEYFALPLEVTTLKIHPGSQLDDYSVSIKFN